MLQHSRLDPASTFVVRLWPDWSAAGVRWRGRIEHLQSGESAAFLDLAAMLDFIRRFSGLEDDNRQGRVGIPSPETQVR